MDLTSIDWGSLIQGALGAAGLITGGAYAKRKLQEKHAFEQEGIAEAVGQEWKELATIRAGKIAEQNARIGELEARVAKLEGYIDALESMKENRIADRVVELLVATQVADRLGDDSS